MEHTRMLPITAVITLLLLLLALPAQQVAHPHNLRYGPHPVGFRSMVLFDTTRTYDLTCGDTTIHIGNRDPGRPLVVNVWYPARNRCA